MDATGGNNVNQQYSPTKTKSEEYMVDHVAVQTPNDTRSNDVPCHPVSLNLSVPVRCLYHEQAKSIVAIQVRLILHIQSYYYYSSTFIPFRIRY